MAKNWHIILKKNKEDANDLMEQKANLEKSKKDAEELAIQKEKQRDSKIRTIGNIVHDSVPVSNNEVRIVLGLRRETHLTERTTVRTTTP